MRSDPFGQRLCFVPAGLRKDLATEIVFGEHIPVNQDRASDLRQGRPDQEVQEMIRDSTATDDPQRTHLTASIGLKYS
jgi:hypothetical protein